MTELSLNRKFDLITSVLDSTNYITDIEGLKKYFKGVYDHLKDDGIFIFDISQGKVPSFWIFSLTGKISKYPSIIKILRQQPR